MTNPFKLVQQARSQAMGIRDETLNSNPSLPVTQPATGQALPTGMPDMQAPQMPQAQPQAAPAKQAARPEPRSMAQQLTPLFHQAEQNHGVPAQILEAIAWRESNMNPAAYNKQSGATGLMQIIPSTAQWLGVDPSDPQQAVEGAAKYLSYLLGVFGGDWRKAIAAYHAGQGNVKKAIQKYGDEWLENGDEFRIGPITRDYVQELDPVIGGVTAEALPTQLASADPRGVMFGGAGSPSARVPAVPGRPPRVSPSAAAMSGNPEMPGQEMGVSWQELPDDSERRGMFSGDSVAPRMMPVFSSPQMQERLKFWQLNPEDFETSPQREMGEGRFMPLLKVGGKRLVQAILGFVEVLAGDEFLSVPKEAIEESIAKDVADMRPDVQAHRLMKWDTLSKDKSVWHNLQAIITQLTEQLPNFAATMLPAIGVGIRAGKLGMTGAQIAARAGAVGAASEGTIVTGFAFNDIQEQVGNATHEQLLNSEKYRERIAMYGDSPEGQAQARENLAMEIGRFHSLSAGLTSATIAGVAGAYLGRLFGLGRSGGRIKAGLKTAGVEGLTEAPQEGSEVLLTNLAAQQSFDPDRDITEGLANAMIAGGVLGALMGGGMGVVAGGRRGRQDRSPEPEAEPDADLDTEVAATPEGVPTAPAAQPGDTTGLAGLGKGMAGAIGTNLRARLWAEYQGKTTQVDPVVRRAMEEAPGMDRETFIKWIENPPAAPIDYDRPAGPRVAQARLKRGQELLNKEQDPNDPVEDMSEAERLAWQAMAQTDALGEYLAKAEAEGIPTEQALKEWPGAEQAMAEFMDPTLFTEEDLKTNLEQAGLVTSGTREQMAGRLVGALMKEVENATATTETEAATPEQQAASERARKAATVEAPAGTLTGDLIDLKFNQKSFYEQVVATVKKYLDPATREKYKRYTAPTRIADLIREIQDAMGPTAGANFLRRLRLAVASGDITNVDQLFATVAEELKEHAYRDDPIAGTPEGLALAFAADEAQRGAPKIKEGEVALSDESREAGYAGKQKITRPRGFRLPERMDIMLDYAYAILQAVKKAPEALDSLTQTERDAYYVSLKRLQDHYHSAIGQKPTFGRTGEAGRTNRADKIAEAADKAVENIEAEKAGEDAGLAATVEEIAEALKKADLPPAELERKANRVNRRIKLNSKQAKDKPTNKTNVMVTGQTSSAAFTARSLAYIYNDLNVIEQKLRDALVAKKPKRQSAKKAELSEYEAEMAETMAKRPARAIITDAEITESEANGVLPKYIAMAKKELKRRIDRYYRELAEVKDSYEIALLTAERKWFKHSTKGKAGRIKGAKEGFAEDARQLLRQRKLREGALRVKYNTLVKGSDVVISKIEQLKDANAAEMAELRAMDNAFKKAIKRAPLREKQAKLAAKVKELENAEQVDKVALGEARRALEDINRRLVDDTQGAGSIAADTMSGVPSTQRGKRYRRPKRPQYVAQSGQDLQGDRKAHPRPKYTEEDRAAASRKRTSLTRRLFFGSPVEADIANQGDVLYYSEQHTAPTNWVHDVDAKDLFVLVLQEAPRLAGWRTNINAFRSLLGKNGIALPTSIETMTEAMDFLAGLDVDAVRGAKDNFVVAVRRIGKNKFTGARAVIPGSQAAVVGTVADRVLSRISRLPANKTRTERVRMVIGDNVIYKNLDKPDPSWTEFKQLLKRLTKAQLNAVMRRLNIANPQLAKDAMPAAIMKHVVEHGSKPAPNIEVVVDTTPETVELLNVVDEGPAPRTRGRASAQQLRAQEAIQPEGGFRSPLLTRVGNIEAPTGAKLKGGQLEVVPAKTKTKNINTVLEDIGMAELAPHFKSMADAVRSLVDTFNTQDWLWMEGVRQAIATAGLDALAKYDRLVNNVVAAQNNTDLTAAETELLDFVKRIEGSNTDVPMYLEKPNVVLKFTKLYRAAVQHGLAKRAKEQAEAAAEAAALTEAQRAELEAAEAYGPSASDTEALMASDKLANATLDELIASQMADAAMDSEAYDALSEGLQAHQRFDTTSSTYRDAALRQKVKRFARLLGNSFAPEIAKSLTERLQARLAPQQSTETINLRDVLHDISAELQRSDNKSVLLPLTQYMVRQLASLNLDVPIVVGKLPPNVPASYESGIQQYRDTNFAKFDPSRRRITVDPSQAYSPGDLLTSVIHEAVHAATANKLAFDADFNAKIENLRQIAVDALIERGDLTQEMLSDPTTLPHEYYGLTNPAEFLSELFSSAAFQNVLASIDMPGPRPAGLLDALVQMIKRALGIAADRFTLLEAAYFEGLRGFETERMQLARATGQAFELSPGDWSQMRGAVINAEVPGVPPELVKLFGRVSGGNYDITAHILRLPPPPQIMDYLRDNRLSEARRKYLFSKLGRTEKQAAERLLSRIAEIRHQLDNEGGTNADASALQILLTNLDYLLVAEALSEANYQMDRVDGPWGQMNAPSAADIRAGVEKSANNGFSFIKTLGRKGNLGFMDYDFMERKYRRLFDKAMKSADFDHMSNPLSAYVQSENRSSGLMRRQLNKGVAIAERMSKLSAKDKKVLGKLQLASTQAGIYADAETFSPTNKNGHLFRKGIPAAERNHKKAYEKVRGLYVQLTPEGKKAYVDGYEFNRELFDTRLREVKKLYAKRYGLPVDQTNKLLAAKSFKRVESLIKKGELVIDEKVKPQFLRSMAQMMEIKRLQGPYFHVARPGDFVVSSTDDGPQWFSSHATEFEAQQKAKELEGQGRTVQVSTKIKSASLGKPLQSMMGDLLSHMGLTKKQRDQTTDAATKAAQDNMYDLLSNALTGILAEGSVIEASRMQRRNIEGANYKDMFEGFINYANSSLYALTDIATAYESSEALKNLNLLQKENRLKHEDSVLLSQVVDEIKTRMKSTAAHRDVGWFQKTVGMGGFMIFLGAPSYWALNSTQTAVVGAPILGARVRANGKPVGMKKAYKALAEAYNVIGKAGKASSFLDLDALINAIPDAVRKVHKKLPKAEQDALAAKYQDVAAKLRDDGSISSNLAAQFGDLLQQYKYGESPYKKTMWKLLKHFEEMPTRIEHVNRLTMGLAATALGADYITARDVTNESQFIYDAPNRGRLLKMLPEWLGGGARPIVSPVMMFRVFGVNMTRMFYGNTVDALKISKKLRDPNLTADQRTELLEQRQEALRIVGGLLFTHTIAGGMKGGLGLGAFQIIAATINSMLDDEDKIDYERTITDFIAGATNEYVASIAMKGAPAIVGADMSGSINLGNLLFMMRDTDWSRAGGVENSFVSLLGAPVQYVRGATRATAQLVDGQIDAGQFLEKTIPLKFGQGIMRSYNLMTDGLQTGQGHTIMQPGEVGVSGAFWNFMGMRAANINRRQSEYYSDRKFDTRMEGRKSSLLRELAEAQTFAQQREAEKKRQEWNARMRSRGYPDLAITHASVLKSKKARQDLQKQLDAGVYSKYR